MRKKLVLITGTSTAGKSTFAEALLASVLPEQIWVIPQATTRPPRIDDDKRFLEYLPDSVFYKQPFFSCYGSYGILQRSYDDFLKSDCRLGLSIVSDLDVIDFSKKAKDVSLFRVLITLAQDLKTEKDLIAKRIQEFFPPEKQSERTKMMSHVAERSYFCENYVKQYTDAHFSLTGQPLSHWVTHTLSNLEMPIPEKITDICKGILSSDKRQQSTKECNMTEKTTKKQPNFEVEVRGLLSKKQYNDLKAYMDQNATKKELDDRRTCFFEIPNATLKVAECLDKGTAKIAFKTGDIITSQAQGEFEFPIPPELAPNMTELFTNLLIHLGHPVRWPSNQKRINYWLDGYEFALKWSEAYGYHYEAETIVHDKKHIPSARNKLETYLKTKLGLPIMTKEQFVKLAEDAHTKFAVVGKPAGKHGGNSRA
ncbi:MAG: hypothetical protein II942_04930 [Alphaproteobacteria bacterium]|nr:hypothetical protein [Alphaproteobacteria bacterium]